MNVWVSLSTILMRQLSDPTTFGCQDNSLDIKSQVGGHHDLHPFPYMTIKSIQGGEQKTKLNILINKYTNYHGWREWDSTYKNCKRRQNTMRERECTCIKA